MLLAAKQLQIAAQLMLNFAVVRHGRSPIGALSENLVQGAPLGLPVFTTFLGD